MAAGYPGARRKIGILSQLRHPGDKAMHLETMLQDPCPNEQAERLEVAAEAADSVLTLRSDLRSGNGFLDDVEGKAALAEAPRRNWQAAVSPS